MKKFLIIGLAACAFLLANKVFSQGFVTSVEDEGFSGLNGNECILKLVSGEEIRGKFTGGTYVKDGLSKISIKMENGEKAKFKPEQVASVRINASGMAKLSMVSANASSIKEIVNTDFNATVKREYIIFETALTPDKKDTYRLLQLLNPGFDNKIKVYAEPNVKTSGLNINGIQLTGGEAKAYLFVKGGEKATLVKKGSYSKGFEELYSDCPKMLAAFQGQKVSWDDIALHVFAYDQACK
jgi:hypothetical protein